MCRQPVLGFRLAVGGAGLLLLPMLQNVCVRAARRLHLLTKHRVFSGPGFLVAQEIGDAAHGGQVAVSHDAWLELRNNMDQVPPAGFEHELFVSVVGCFAWLLVCLAVLKCNSQCCFNLQPPSTLCSADKASKL